jgi:hypothetical protein
VALYWLAAGGSRERSRLLPKPNAYGVSRAERTFRTSGRSMPPDRSGEDPTSQGLRRGPIFVARQNIYQGFSTREYLNHKEAVRSPMSERL